MLSLKHAAGSGAACPQFLPHSSLFRRIVVFALLAGNIRENPSAMWRFYLEVARSAFRRQLIYRWANVAGLMANIFFGVIFSSLIIALFRARSTVASFDVRATLSYTWIVQAMMMMVMTFGWYELMQTIHSGEVVSDLSKPLDLSWYWFSRELGRAAYYVVFRGIPTYLIGLLIFRLWLPATWQTWLWFAAALAPAVMLGVVFRYLYNIVAFWLLEARSAAIMATLAASFFGGSYIPIPFFPGWLRDLDAWLPFNGMLNLPAEVFLGRISGLDLAMGFFSQVAWLAVLIVLARSLTARAFRRVVSQGG
jgi:ABC-2 type transport system permease protein